MWYRQCRLGFRVTLGIRAAEGGNWRKYYRAVTSYSVRTPLRFARVYAGVITNIQRRPKSDEAGPELVPVSTAKALHAETGEGAHASVDAIQAPRRNPEESYKLTCVPLKLLLLLPWRMRPPLPTNWNCIGVGEHSCTAVVPLS